MAALLAGGVAVVTVVVAVIGVQSWYGRDGTCSWPSAVPVLGGFAPSTHAWSRFHARWYPMALVFIAFEMEMMFMYPWAVVFVREGAPALIEMGVFLSILSIGILYGWRERVFRWQ